MTKAEMVKKLYVEDMLSVKQISEQLGFSPGSVRHQLSKANVSIRTRSEAITQIYISRFGKKPFRLKKI